LVLRYFARMNPFTLAAVLQAMAVTEPTSVLIMPLANKEGVSRDLADQITVVITHLSGSVPGFRTVALDEVQGAMTQEQLRQVAACDQVSCAADIGGALNTEQVVIGTLGLLGDEYLLTLTRIQSTDAKRLASVVQRIPAQPKSALLDGAGAVVPNLFGGQTSASIVAPAPTSDPPARGPSPPPDRTAARPPEPPTGPSPLALVPWLMRGLGVAGIAGTLPLVLASLLLAGFVVTVAVQDGPPALPGQPKAHAVTPGMAILADAGGLGAVAAGLLVLGGAGVSLSLLLVSFLVPT
jgi:hypothetical protein